MGNKFELYYNGRSKIMRLRADDMHLIKAIIIALLSLLVACSNSITGQNGSPNPVPGAQPPIAPSKGNVLNSPSPSAPPPPAPPPSGVDYIAGKHKERSAGASPPYMVVQVYFATDRQVSTRLNRTVDFCGKRANFISYGSCEVTIPRDHRMGELESPSFLRLEFTSNPDRHVVLRSTNLASKEDFFLSIAEAVKASSTKKAFIFIHGYNVTFEDAARRTAQMAYDLNFDGASAFYSWPSQGEVGSYTVDEQNIEWAKVNIQGFLEDFLTRSHAECVYLIAHSMGNRGLAGALLALLVDKPELRIRIKEVILAAPDIDSEIFKRDIAPVLSESGQSVTLYASSEDNALLASKKVHGYPRAGDAGSGLIVAPGIETIDATDVDTSFLGHSYYADTSAVLSDIYYLIRFGHKAYQRFNLVPVETSIGRYWKFRR